MPRLDIKVLLDTNILIQTEDNKKIDRNFAEFLQKCHHYGIRVYIHEASIEDINRDKDLERRGITLSKAAKYPILEKIPCPDIEDLEAIYGHIKHDNDHVDVKLLNALSRNAVSLLVSEDLKLHNRADKAGLSDRVLLIAEVLVWLKQTYEPTSIDLPFVEQIGCHQVDINQDIFVSLKEDYNEFKDWFGSKCVPEHRPCWTITDGKRVLAIAIWKPESAEDFSKEFDSEPSLGLEKNSKILKVCTYKVHDEYRGSKIGEHLLKQVLWYGFANRYDWVYLTAYEAKQSYLISFLKKFGFSIVGNKKGEVILAKKYTYSNDNALNENSPIDFHRQFYPSYYDGDAVRKYIIPVKPKFHLKLFPEYSPSFHPTLFSDSDLFSIKDQIPGNTIRKVYLGRPNLKDLLPGSLAFFYMSKDDAFLYSQSLTIIGIIDGVTECKSVEEVMQATAKRSVYSKYEVECMFHGNDNPIKAVDFFIAGHIQQKNSLPPKLNDLLDAGILTGVPQSMISIKEEKYKRLKELITVIH